MNVTRPTRIQAVRDLHPVAYKNNLISKNKYAIHNTVRCVGYVMPVLQARNTPNAGRYIIYTCVVY